MKRIILHIGKCKTGTSSIQNTLYAEREKLRKRSIYYPDIHPPNHGKTFWLAFDVNKINLLEVKKREHAGLLYQDQLLKYKKMWVEEFEKNTCDTFIISGEYLGRMRASNIIILKEYLKKYFDQVTIIVYVRHYATFLSSMIQQQIKAGRSPFTIDQLTDRMFSKTGEWPFLSFQTLEHWQDVFGKENVIIKPYDPRVFKNNNLLDDFFDTLGLIVDINNYKDAPVNVSLGNNAVRLLEAFNNKYPSLIDNQLNLDRGLGRRMLPFNVFRIKGDERFSIDVSKLKDSYIKKLNEEIVWANNNFKDGYKFETITKSTDDQISSASNTIPVEFFAEVLNNFAKEHERRLDTLDKYKDTLSRYKKRIDNYEQKILHLKAQIKNK